MKTTYCSAGYRNEKAWEQRRIVNRIMVCESLCNAGDVTFMSKDAHTYENCHYEQSRTKNGINGSDDLIDREDCNGQIENEYRNSPNQVSIGNIKQPQGQLFHQSGRNQHKRCTNANHQHQSDNTHH